MFREKIQVSSFTQMIQEEIGKNHKSLAENVRKKLIFQNIEPLNVILLILPPLIKNYRSMFVKFSISLSLTP